MKMNLVFRLVMYFLYLGFEMWDEVRCIIVRDVVFDLSSVFDIFCMVFFVRVGGSVVRIFFV